MVLPGGDQFLLSFISLPADATLLRTDGSIAATATIFLTTVADADADESKSSGDYTLSLQAPTGPQASEAAVLDGKAFTLSLLGDRTVLSAPHASWRRYILRKIGTADVLDA